MRDIPSKKINSTLNLTVEDISKNIVDYSNTILFILDIKWGYRFEFINSYFEMITGYSPRLLYNKPGKLKDIVHPDDWHYLEDFMKNPKDLDAEIRWINKNGAIIWTEQHLRLIKDDHITGWITDITKKKTEELSLRESELKYKTLFNYAPIAYQSLDSNANILDVNATWLKIMGYKKEDIIGKWFIDFVHPDDSNTFKNNFSNLIQKGTTARTQIKIQQSNGNYICVSFEGSVLKNVDGNFSQTFCAFSNISAEKQHEEKLKKSEEKFRSIFDYTNMGIVITDVNGSLIDINKSFCNLLGYNKDELLRQNFKDFTHPDDLDKELILVNKLRKKHKSSYRLEKRYITKSGKTIWVEAAIAFKSATETSPEMMIGIILDIEDKINPSHQLIHNEKHFSQLFENMEQGFALHEMIYDEYGKGIDYRFILMNKAFEKLTGMKRNELIGYTVKEKLPDTENSWIENYSKVAESGEALHFENYSSAFNKYYDVVAYSPRKGFFATIFTDVTRSREYQNNLLKAKERSEQSDQIKSKFLQNLSHEIRTPMNGIIGFSRILNTQELPKEKQNFYTDIILKSAEQLLRIIDDVLEISTLETKQVKLQLEHVCLNELLSEIFSIFSISAENTNAQLKLSKTQTDSNSYIETDRTKLSKIINNLLDNALKYTNEGSIELGYMYSNNMVEIYVKDTGIGIDSQNFELIFQRFSQENQNPNTKVDGLGLGLSIAKENTELLGGKIKVESIQGEGSTFKILLPIEFKTNSQSVEDNKPEVQNNYYRVLIAEDEEINYIFMREILSSIENVNLEILHAKNGQEAIDICRSSKKIDLILMDIKMPVLNGLEATKYIKQMNADLPIIVQSAYASNADKEIAFNLGCDEYLSKPIDTDKLINLTLRYLTKH